MTAEGPFGLPEEGHEDRLAFRLAGNEKPLEVQIMHMLAGKPRRFRDFKVLVPKGKSDTPIARALHGLAEEGLIDRGMTSHPDDSEFRYSLSGLGVQVLFRSHEFKQVATVIQELRTSHVLV